MTRSQYAALEAHMLAHMTDSAHDAMHAYRVLGAALDIAAHEGAVDTDILIAACLLHDIAREKQFRDPAVDHALEGGRMAEAYLLGQGWPGDRAARVGACIETHRYRKSRPPESLEARILFDADKLEAAGAIGIARTLVYEGVVGELLYRLDGGGQIVTTPDDADITTFFQEFSYKLEGIYDSFYTARATEIAATRRQTALAFRDALLEELSAAHGALPLLDGLLT